MKPVVTLLALLLVAVPAGAGTLTGTVRNATTGQPVAGQDVVLLSLQGGMEVAATARSGAGGRFQLDHPSLGAAPMLLRVTYKGVNYHENVPPGASAADVTIYEPTDDPRAFRVHSRFVVLQPNGPALLVGEEFLIVNASEPPVAYYKPDGTFEFFLPEGAELAQVSAWGPSGMPLVQGTMDKGGSRMAIAFPFRPGENGVRISYQMPYPGNRATVRVSSPYPAERVMLAAPPEVELAGAGFQPAGTEQGYALYARDALPPGATIEFTVSGAGSLAAEGGAEGAPGQAAASGSVQMMPPRLDSLKWVLIAGFGALFALGAIYLWRKPRMLGAAAPAGMAPAQAEVNRQVSHSLDELKDTLFRLELRRQAGTISEEDYAAEYARAQKQLRDLVKG